MPDEPIIDLHSDDYFMREALRRAARAMEADEVPIGAVIVREGRIIARAFNQVEALKDATAHAEMLALTQAQEIAGDNSRLMPFGSTKPGRQRAEHERPRLIQSPPIYPR